MLHAGRVRQRRECCYLEVKHVGVAKVVEERPGQGHIVLGFDADGRLLGVESIGSATVLYTAVLDSADRI